jgi:integrase
LLRAIDRLEWPRRQFIYLLLLTAQRFGEVADMEWSQVDDASATPKWTLPDTKNGNAHVVPLTPVAVEVLKGMDRTKASPRVFPSFSAAHVKKRVDAIMMEIAREDATARGEDPETVTVIPWRLHDLRRTAATTMPDLGIDVTTVERVLNHQLRGVKAVYQLNTFMPQKRHALSVWADFLANLTMGRETNVVSIRAEAS